MQGHPRKPANLWIVDSGCSRHMTGDSSLLNNFVAFNGGSVAFGGEDGGHITGQGTVSNGRIGFDQVNLVEELNYNLLSVSQVCDKGYKTLFTKDECFILSPEFDIPKQCILLQTHRKEDMYIIDMNNVYSSESVSCFVSKSTELESIVWHKRLGHVNLKNMNKLVKGNHVFGLPSKEFFLNDHCISCLKGKQHRSSFKLKLINSVDAPLHLLHMDLFGPISVKSLGKKSYCLVITDDYSRFSWVFFLATKDETPEIIKAFIVQIEVFIGKKVKIIRCDNGTEFKNRVLNEFCIEKGITRQYSSPRTPQQNGVAERKNRTLIEGARTMLCDSMLPVTFWAEAVNTTCYVQNRVHIVKALNKTSYELLIGRKPFIGFLKSFGCPCTLLNTKDHLNKFESKVDDGYFVGYSSVSKAYRVYNRRARIIEESIHVIFNENTPTNSSSGPSWLFDLDKFVN